MSERITNPRYRTVSGKQADGSDVDLEVCMLCGYTDSHDDGCPTKAENRERKRMKWIEVGQQQPPERLDLLLWVDNIIPIVGYKEGDRFYSVCEDGTLRGRSRVEPSHWMLIEKPEQKGKQ